VGGLRYLIVDVIFKYTLSGESLENEDLARGMNLEKVKRLLRGLERGI
jgi:hypothetical protein